MHRRLIAPGRSPPPCCWRSRHRRRTTPPGAPGIGDPYYPAYGNGGYDVSHYDLRLQHQRATDELQGTATLLATTTQDLSRFDLDFLLDVSEVRVNGAKASFTTSGQHELEITPATPLPRARPSRSSSVTAGCPRRRARTASRPGTALRTGPSRTSRVGLAAVPQQRPSERQGHVRRLGGGAGRYAGDFQRHAPVDEFAARLDPLQLAVQQAAGDLSRDARHRKIRHHDGHDGRRRPGRQRVQQGPRRQRRGRAGEHQRTGEIVDWLTGYFGPYPFSSVGGYVPNTTTGYALETQTRVYYSPGSSRTAPTPPWSSMSWRTSGTATTCP